MENEIQKRIALGRSFITKFGDEAGIPEDYQTDQELKKPQPPLVKAPMGSDRTELPSDFSVLPIDKDFLHIINSRKSSRIYTEEHMSLAELSYLLWCAQGVKSIRGKAYATLRTVPSGGARHPFECYLAVQNVDGLQPGFYHYLPIHHEIERLGTAEDLKSFVTASLCGQSWAGKANVVFYLSCVYYRAEWRYGIWAHAPILMDSGHVTENLYLAAASVGLGGCAVAAVDPDLANSHFGLDGVEECIFYAMPVGRVRKEDQEAENEIYAFVRDEGL